MPILRGRVRKGTDFVPERKINSGKERGTGMELKNLFRNDLGTGMESKNLFRNDLGTGMGSKNHSGTRSVAENFISLFFWLLVSLSIAGMY